MQPELPSVPPPILPASGPNDAYGFITNPAAPPKRSILPTGGSKKNRIVIVVGGFVALILFSSLIFAVINGLTSGQKADWLSLAQKQAELIRITDIGTAKAQQRDTKNLAATTKVTLLASQTTINSLAKKNGATINTRSLLGGKDPATDTALTTAEQANQFDDTFHTILKNKLSDYQQLLKKIYDSTSSKSTKSALSNIYNNAGILVDESKQ